MAEGASRYRPLLEAVAAGAHAEHVAEAKWLSVPGSAPPWTDTGIDLAAGERVSVLAGGRLVMSEELRLWFRPALYLWRRIGEKGPIFKAPRDTATHTAARPGRLQLAVAPPHWSMPEGDWEGSDGEYSGLPGSFDALLIRWAGDPLEGLRALRAHAPDDPRIRAEIERLEGGPVEPPPGWEYLWFLGDSESFSGATRDGRRVICAHPDDDAAILRKPVSLTLTPETRLRWRWKLERLPSRVAEDQLPTHDYLSIALEFDNGQDLTWYWSAALPEETCFRCPLPWWDRHETHLVVRSGAEGLGRWHAEERRVHADYRRAVGEPPARIVAVWLIAVSAFSHSRGLAEFADIALADGDEILPVL